MTSALTQKSRGQYTIMITIGASCPRCARTRVRFVLADAVGLCSAAQVNSIFTPTCG